MEKFMEQHQELYNMFVTEFNQAPPITVFKNYVSEYLANHRKEYCAQKIECKTCGISVRRDNFKAHERSYACQVARNFDDDTKRKESHDIRQRTIKENRLKGNNKTSKSTSEYKGVSRHKHLNKWYAKISKDGVHYSLGYHEDEIEAAKAYNKKALELYGSNVYLNKV